MYESRAARWDAISLTARRVVWNMALTQMKDWARCECLKLGRRDLRIEYVSNYHRMD